MPSEKTPIVGSEIKSNTYYDLDESYLKPKKSNMFIQFFRKLYEFIVKPPTQG